MGVFDKFDWRNEKSDETKNADGEAVEVMPANMIDTERGFVSENNDQLQRRLGNRQIQLIAIGGSIGMSNFSRAAQCFTVTRRTC